MPGGELEGDHNGRPRPALATAVLRPPLQSLPSSPAVPHSVGYYRQPWRLESLALSGAAARPRPTVQAGHRLPVLARHSRWSLMAGCPAWRYRSCEAREALGGPPRSLVSLSSRPNRNGVRNKHFSNTLRQDHPRTWLKGHHLQLPTLAGNWPAGSMSPPRQALGRRRMCPPVLRTPSRRRCDSGAPCSACPWRLRGHARRRRPVRRPPYRMRRPCWNCLATGAGNSHSGCASSRVFGCFLVLCLCVRLRDRGRSAARRGWAGDGRGRHVSGGKGLRGVWRWLGPGPCRRSRPRPAAYNGIQPVKYFRF